MSVSVRISGKKGKVNVEAKEAKTVGEAVAFAAEALGIEGYDPSRAKLMVDGAEVTADTPVTDGAKVDAAPAARLG